MAGSVESDAGPGAPVGRLFSVDLTTDHPLACRLDQLRGGRLLAFACQDPTGTFDSPETLEGVESVTGEPWHSPLGRGRHTALRLLGTRAGDLVIRFGETLDFRIGIDRIDCRLFAPEHLHLVELRFLGPVMAFWLERQGLPALHASAVVLGGRAAAFLSGNGGGKTSLAAALVEAGHALLTDDVLAVEPAALPPGPAPFLARPGYPQMRMWPRDAERFLGSAAGLERVHPRYSKLRVPVGEGGFGSFHHDSAPLGAVYLVERGEAAPPRTPARIEPLLPHRALIELVRHSFVPRLVEAAGLQPRRLELLARLVERVPVRRLVVPSGPGGLESARDAVLAEI